MSELPCGYTYINDPLPVFLSLNARYGEAEDTLRKIPTITDTRDLCVLALVLRKAGKAADAMEVYEQVGWWRQRG